MKKRIACILMTLILLVSLVPLGAVTADAASHSTSAAAITVLKKLTQFKGECYQVGNTQEVRIGYGTICEEEHEFKNDSGKYEMETPSPLHTIKENEADTALRAALKDYDKKVNAFASSNNLNLNQNQHDALVIFSYGSGTAWMDGNGVVKTAILNSAGFNELLNAMNLWTDYRDTARRKIEVNMYFNGVYSNVVSSSIGNVTYNANRGSMAQHSNYDGNGNEIYTMLFDTTETVAHDPVPTRDGYIFLGWYASVTEPTWSGSGYDSSVWELMSSLTGVCDNHTLYALWQPRNQAAATNAGVGVKYTLSRSSLASRTIYTWPDLTSKACEEKGSVENSTVTVYRDYIAPDGTRWAKIDANNNRWVIVRAGSNGAGSSGTDIDVTVTVTNSYVNMRVNATIFSAKNGSWSQGKKLRIINTASADGYLWGQVAKSEDDDEAVGWVALMYTNWNDVKDGGSSGSSTSTKVIARATVTINGYINLRSDPGTDNKIVGALAKNETVDIYEIRTVNGHRWGRTAGGWFCLTYASVSMLTSESNISDEGALAYTFTGTSSNGGVARVSANHNSNTVEFVDAKNNKYHEIPAGTDVTITNLVVVSGETWAKATWQNTEKDKDNKDIKVTRSGWVVLPGVVSTFADSTTAKVTLDPVKYTVVADEVSVRKTPDNAAELVIKLNKGVEIEVTHITLVGENIWGYTDSEAVKDGADKDANVSPYVGYVNLASKYFQRSSLPTVESNSHNTGLMATVINTDSVRVRNYGSTTAGTVIGSLSRGTTVAVWEIKNDGEWYKVDSNQNGSFEEDDGWVSGQYLDVYEASDSSSGGSTSGTTSTTTGTGIVVNTYSGVNVRSGAGMAYASRGKLLNGTRVKILETTTVGATKWGRVSQGWICMDYVQMISYDQTTTTTPSGNGTAVSDLDTVEKTTTTAVYTGKTNQEVWIRETPSLGDDAVTVLEAGSNITIYELLAVTDMVDEESSENNEGGSSTVTTITSYWARVNNGYIYNPGDRLNLDALDEKVHTLTGAETLNVRESAGGKVIEDLALKKGDQVTVTSLQIVNDKVWGRAETEDGYVGWIRLDYMSEGAYYVQQNTTSNNTNTNTNNAVIGSTGNTSTGGFVTNTAGYKYTGKVINTNSVNVRSIASTTGTVTTTLSSGQSLVIYETTISENMAWGRCDAGWVYLYYVDMTPASGNGAIDARVVYNDNTVIYSDSSMSTATGSTYARMSVVDIYEVVGTMARTELGWVKTTDLL